MPQVILTASALRGLSRCIRFLGKRDKDAVKRAALTIDARFAQLRAHPMVGRPVLERPGQRELVIRFGKTGYVALYRYDASADAVYILAFRHQREAGY